MLPPGHDRQAVADRGQGSGPLLGEEHRCARGGDALDGVEHEPCAACVKMGHGLVEHEVAGPHGQESGDDHELLLAP